MQRLNDVISLIHIGENLQTAFVVGLADLGETDLARAAVEQTRAEPFLERLDLTRHRAGRRVELAARCRESAGVTRDPGLLVGGRRPAADDLVARGAVVPLARGATARTGG